MKQKFINFNKTGEAKAKYGADAVVIEQETKYGIQYILMDGNGASMKYEKIYNSEEEINEEVDPSEIDVFNEDVEYSESGDENEQAEELNVSKFVLRDLNKNKDFKKEDNYLELAFGKIINGKGSFLKGLAKTTGLKFAYEITNQMKKSGNKDIKTIGLLSGLKEARIKLKDDLRELGIKQSQFDSRKGLQQALNILKRKGEFKTLQRLMKFNLDFNKKGANTLLKLINIRDPRVLNKELDKKGLGKKQAKQLITNALLWKKKKGKK